MIKYILFTIHKFLILLGGFFLPQTALADTFTLSGHVFDSSGSAIAGSRITVTDRYYKCLFKVNNYDEI